MTTERRQDIDELLTPSEVAKLFRVDPKTVTRWAKSGKLSAIRTLGGHRRYHAAEVHELLSGQTDGSLAAGPQSLLRPDGQTRQVGGQQDGQR